MIYQLIAIGSVLAAFGAGYLSAHLVQAKVKAKLIQEHETNINNTFREAWTRGWESACNAPGTVRESYRTIFVDFDK